MIMGRCVNCGFTFGFKEDDQDGCNDGLCSDCRKLCELRNFYQKRLKKREAVYYREKLNFVEAVLQKRAIRKVHSVQKDFDKRSYEIDGAERYNEIIRAA